jgi:23S rRNA (cytidine2498-2'-O)-methyltransferase
MDTQTDDQLILSCDPASGSAAWHEIGAASPGARLLEWLAPGIGHVASRSGWDALAARLRAQPPVFCRHVCPVQARVLLAQGVADLDRLAAACEPFVPRLRAAEAFSVQTRLLGNGWPYARYDVNVRLAERFTARGIPLDVRRPQQVLSVVLAPGQGYLGLSRAADNLSDWAGGERRFKREAGQVSRAEFKLLEAIELFALHLPAGGTALDLGAAPGGWTRVLRQHGMQVVAVDPAALDPRVASDPGVKHVRETAQHYLLGADRAFDVLLNDMRMDARDSARVVVEASQNLEPDGWALLTLKLPENRMAQVTAAALDLLRARYQVIGARQLFHNRSEITVALKHRQA